MTSNENQQLCGFNIRSNVFLCVTGRSTKKNHWCGNLILYALMVLLAALFRSFCDV